MKAFVYCGPGKRAWEETPQPTIKDGADAIARITTTSIAENKATEYFTERKDDR